MKFYLGYYSFSTTFHYTFYSNKHFLQLSHYDYFLLKLLSVSVYYYYSVPCSCWALIFLINQNDEIFIRNLIILFNVEFFMIFCYVFMRICWNGCCLDKALLFFNFIYRILDRFIFVMTRCLVGGLSLCCWAIDCYIRWLQGCRQGSIWIVAGC